MIALVLFGLLILGALFGAVCIADATSRQPRCDCEDCERAHVELPTFIGSNW
jgi:hypothetical protein